MLSYNLNSFYEKSRKLTTDGALHQTIYFMIHFKSGKKYFAKFKMQK
jgi:hypothetical protein